MSRSYLKPFTSKKAISFVFLGLSCFVFNNPAHSESENKIIGHYYVATDKDYEKYVDKIQWEVTSVDEWSKFSFLDGVLMRKLEQELLRKSDVVITTAKTLFHDKLRVLNL